MSSNLHWRTPNPEGQSFGYALKFPLREQWGGMVDEWTLMDQHDIPFLKGVIAGAGKDSEVGKEAAFLVAKIEKHGSIEIREVY